MFEIQEGLVKPGFRVNRAGLVVSLQIERPDKKNALTQSMWLDLAVLFEALAADKDVRAIVLSGTGGHFCAGADISEFDTVRRGERAAIYEDANSRAFRAVRDCPVPTIAAINGICFGGGFGLAAACDLRVASPDALFSVPAARLGLAYPVDAMADIVHALGPQLARYMTFTAGRLDAPTAQALGFLLEVTDLPPAIDRALEIATVIATNAPLSVRASKAAIRAVLTADPLDNARAAELGGATFTSADYEEGRTAFKEKRNATFTGL
ncbi:enoyl-CoA hydratase/isomerase family protein [Aliihoeflea sp. 40Bstr573]|uniref:enoyl-CoA hydratase/isomerase family protein n=1 Tax=Aliihoeflea sp. 40Bstr573 TaxID=2696467 RepID=UPI0020953F7F|nr:enoyl-CoA hydratase-related protein [Aliihoeflea sp. 40Bstr573]